MLPPEFGHQPTWSLPRHQFGDGEADHVYMAVGKALSQWEELETSLSELFTRFAEAQSAAAARAYGTIASAQGRFDLLDAAAEVYFGMGGPGSDEHKLIVKVLRLAAPCRNNIAHGVVREYAAPNIPGGGFYLVSSDYNSRRNRAFIDFDAADSIDPFDFARHTYAYTSSQISKLGNRFFRLAREVLNFDRRLGRSRG